MSSSPSVLSDTLQSITITKIRELEKQKTAYNARKDGLLAETAKEPHDVRVRLGILVNELPDVIDAKDEQAVTINNILMWLVQAQYDPSVPEAKLLASEKLLRDYLDRGSLKFDLAHLYSRLLTEWIKSPVAVDALPDDLEGSGSDESFEVVQDTQKARLEQLRDKFARVVFEPLETDENAIEQFLQGLFQGDRQSEKLKRMRASIAEKGESMLEKSFRIYEKDLKGCIKALLANSLLNDEKKASLADFLKDDAVLGEIRDVLNMRLRDIKDWDWNLGEDGMPVVPRRSLNGKWRVMMDEDVLQALLTHWIGTHWAVCLKSVLIDTRKSATLWKQHTRLPEEELAKRQYYFSAYASSTAQRGKNIASERQKIYNDDFFMSSLPSTLHEESGGYDDDDEPSDNDKKSAKDVKQLMLRTLTTEVIVRRSLDGEVAVVQSDFQWFATGIAHSTIFTVMRFVGFQEEWISFFKKVLEPPLNMLDGGPVRTRKRGLPMAHIFEKLLGELILYFMDLAVAQNSGMILYRFHDDLWLAGPPQACADSWTTMKEFAKVMGLEFNQNKTGSVYLTDGKRSKNSDVVKILPKGPVAMSFLVLDAEAGKWIINDDHVQEHVNQLRKQLGESTSILQWMKTWNSCIGRFFSYTFGEPAHCFGSNHIDNTLKTHMKMQKFLFDNEEKGSTVTQYVRHMIADRFGTHQVPDSFIFMPESLGGLGLKNPFIPLLLRRHLICGDPDEVMLNFHESERETYADGKKVFDSLTEKERRKRYKAAFKEDDEDSTPPISWSEAQSFISFEEFTKYRDLDSKDLYDAYNYFLQQPDTDGMQRTASLKSSIKALQYEVDDLAGLNSAETLWTVQYFEDELMDKFGGLEVVDKGLLPMGVLKALRSRKVTWQMVL